MDRREYLNLSALMKRFEEIEDPRQPGGNTQHNLVEILAIVLIAILCACDNIEEIVDYARAKETWLRTILKLEHGLPSESTYRRLLNAVDPRHLEKAYRDWVYPYIGGCLGKQIAIDGKTSCGTVKGVSPVHMVSAWIREDSLTFGQVRTDEKSNEITAIPELLDTLDITGGIVTIDAMGCQREIARKIVEKEANYVLAVKRNHPDLYESIDEYFQWAINDPIEGLRLNTWEDIDRTHGRSITRRVSVSDEIEWYDRKAEWAGARTFIMVERVREREGKSTKETAYYISSLVCTADTFGSLIRGHWSIENNLHWMLDVAFGEDGNQTRQGNAAQNLSLIRKTTGVILKADTSSSASIKRKRKNAAFNNSFAHSLLRLL